MIRLAVLAMFGLAAVSTPAAALGQDDLARCQAMAATMAPKQNEIEQVKAKRDRVAAQLETLREQWEEAETMRNFSADSAAAADTLDADYEGLERTLAQSERGLQGLLQQFNKDVSAYNASCVVD